MGRSPINGMTVDGSFSASAEGESIRVSVEPGKELTGREFFFRPADEKGFLLRDVTIGVQFHWERNEDQTFRGNLRLLRDDAGITAVNEVGLEEYLKSVVSSEMSAESPIELLKAHAITSRSWLMAMLEQQKQRRNVVRERRKPSETDHEFIRWYDREDHERFNVCADDHCQRYQGVSRIISPLAEEAVNATRGMCLVDGSLVCDARFSKACGGLTENFENVWEERSVPYLRSISDGSRPFSPVKGEESASAWIMSRPDAYCNTTSAELLRTILPSFDRETVDFFRWEVTFAQEELAALIFRKSGVDFGPILDLIPLERGPSGRIIRLRIAGSKRVMEIGKELEIRKWLSPSHLYSSAFVVSKTRGKSTFPESFTLHGAGWGHGVGLCQIGAAVMASRGMRAEEILLHYFRGAELRKMY